MSSYEFNLPCKSFTNCGGDVYKELSQAWEELTAEGSQFELEEVNVRGIDLLCYKNQPATLRDFWLSSLRFGNADYLVYGDERISYAEAHEHVASIANWFIENVCR